MRRAAGLVFVIAVVPLLVSCSSFADIAGIVGAVATGSTTASPVAAFVVGISVRAGADELVKYYGRKRQQAEQNAIADVAGRSETDQARLWKIEHTIPYGNEHRELRVVRVIKTPLALCKELVYSVAEQKGQLYTAQICLQQTGWKWANAEPAVGRWGNLQ